MPNLTHKQENFAICFTMNNNNKTKAYKESYDCENMSDAAIYVEACRLAKNPKVALRIDELRKERFSNKVLSIEERKILLSELILEGDTKAHEILNKMEAVYTEKIDVRVTKIKTLEDFYTDET